MGFISHIAWVSPEPQPMVFYPIPIVLIIETVLLCEKA